MAFSLQLRKITENLSHGIRKLHGLSAKSAIFSRLGHRAEPSQAKPSQAKPSQAKPSQAKPSQAKPSQAKPSQSSN
jgi:hypothetical protein